MRGYKNWSQGGLDRFHYTDKVVHFFLCIMLFANKTHKIDQRLPFIKISNQISNKEIHKSSHFNDK